LFTPLCGDIVENNIGEYRVMYAIMEFKGFQYRIEKNAVMKVPYVEKAEIGSELTFDKLLMIGGEGDITLGKPIVSGASAVGEVLRHGREQKIIVFKKKRRKGYRKTQGHRQYFTEVKIKDISLEGGNNGS